MFFSLIYKTIQTSWFKEENKSLNHIQFHSDCFHSINRHINHFLKYTSTSLANIQQKKKIDKIFSHVWWLSHEYNSWWFWNLTWMFFYFKYLAKNMEDDMILWTFFLDLETQILDWHKDFWMIFWSSIFYFVLLS